MVMVYIVALNGIIIAEPLGLDPVAVAAGTALVAGVMTIAMGLVTNYPFAIAAGLGLNAVVTFQLVGAYQLTWPEAMGVVVLEGLIITALVLTKFRQAVMDAVPLPLKLAIGAGIGLFITIIGFIDSGFVASTTVPIPPLQLGVNNELKGWPILVFIFGLFLIIWLFTRRVKGALLIGILSATVLAVIVNEAFLNGEGFGTAANFGKVADFPDGDNFSLIGNFSLFGSFAHIGLISAALAVFTLMLSDFFDTMGTAIGLGREANLLDSEGRLPDTDKVLLVDSAAAAVGGAVSASSNTTYIESASGIADGGRTGLTAVIVGVAFLLSLFLFPLAEIIPLEAAAPALVIVGFLMLSVVREIPWDDLEIAIPSFLTIVLMPFTYSITNGIGAGFIAYTFIKVARGKTSEVHPMMWVASVAFLLYFGIFYVRLYFT
jgi:AGZA family xanthine/uracil permease-like MFS transporter